MTEDDSIVRDHNGRDLDNWPQIMLCDKDWNKAKPSKQMDEHAEDDRLRLIISAFEGQQETHQC